MICCNSDVRAMSAISPIKWLLTHPSTRERPLSVLARWGYWQFRQRITTKPCVVPFLRGTKLKVYPHEGLTGFWYVTYPDYAEMRFMERLLRPGDRFFDVGANAGGIAVFAASLGCKVTAFEPVITSVLDCGQM